MNAGILKGIRILDFTRVLAGPFATRLLGDFGAEVIKVQSQKTAVGAEHNNSGYFKTWNRNKLSITLDLSFKEARDKIRDLVGICDVVVENFSSRVMSNWGLDYVNLKGKKPDLVMLSMSGTGHTGPWKNYVAFGPTVQSLGGLTWLTSYDGKKPSGPGYSHADHVSGLYGAFAVLLALEHRDITGQGQHIDLSEYEAVAAITGTALLETFALKNAARPMGNASEHADAVPHGCYKCLGEDRWCVISVLGDQEWKSLCEAFGHTECAGDKRFSSLQDRKMNAEEVDKLLGEWTIKYSPEEVVALLQEAGVRSAVVQSAEGLINDRHLKQRDFFVRSNHPEKGNMISDRSPLRFAANLDMRPRPAPFLGEDNQYVFKDLLKMTETEFYEYVDRGIIG